MRRRMLSTDYRIRTSGRHSRDELFDIMRKGGIEEKYGPLTKIKEQMLGGEAILVQGEGRRVYKVAPARIRGRIVITQELASSGARAVTNRLLPNAVTRIAKNVTVSRENKERMRELAVDLHNLVGVGGSGEIEEGESEIEVDEEDEE